jgi:tRNA(adenine34) deaminase
MQEALTLAHLAKNENEVPVGAILVKDDSIIARGYNRPISNQDPSAHAEILALREAARALNNYRLTDTTLYCTLEPCVMCAGALVHARVKRLVFGASDSKAGACGSVFDITKGFPLNHKLAVESGVLALECRDILQDFFKKKRTK